MAVINYSQNFDGLIAGATTITGWTLGAGYSVSAAQSNSAPNSLNIALANTTVESYYTAQTDLNNGDVEFNCKFLALLASGATAYFGVRSTASNSLGNSYTGWINFVGASHTVGIDKRTFNSATNLITVTLPVNFSALTWYYTRTRARGPWIMFAVQRPSDSFWLTSAGTWQAAEVDCCKVYDTTFREAGYVGTRIFTANNTTSTCFIDDVNFIAPVLPIDITWPKVFSIYQRNKPQNQATVYVSGTYSSGVPTTVEYSLNGGAWTTLDAAPAAGAYLGSIPNVQGPGIAVIDVRYSNNTPLTWRTYIGIGDVFGVGWQSNGSGRGLVNNVYPAIANNATYTDINMFSSIYRGDETFQLITDPTDINTGQTAAGNSVSDDGIATASMWPIVAGLIASNYGVPTLWVVRAKGGTRLDDGASTSLSWRVPAGGAHFGLASLYGGLAHAMLATTLYGPNAGSALTGLAVIMVGGESDAQVPVSTATMTTNFNTWIAAWVADFPGMKIHFNKLQNCFTNVAVISGANGITSVNTANFNAAIDNISTNVNVIFSDFSDIQIWPDDSPQFLHFKTPPKQGLAASRIFNTLVRNFYQRPATGHYAMQNGGGMG